MLAAHRRLATLCPEGWAPRAGLVWATHAADVHHAVLGMLLAERRRLAALDVKARSRHAGSL